MLSADFIGIPWDLIDEISSPVLNLPICIDVQVKRAPEIVYTGNVHVPLSHLQAKAEEDPDSYLWVIVLNCKQAFRGIAPSLAGSRVLQVRTYKQFHGIPKQGFNSDKSKPEIIRDQLMDALGLSKLINPHKPATFFKFVSDPVKGREDSRQHNNFCFIYKVPRLEIAQFSAIQNKDPETPKWDQLIWSDSDDLLASKCKKIKVNRASTLVLKSAFAHLAVPVTVPPVFKPVAKPVYQKNRFAIDDDDIDDD